MNRERIKETYPLSPMQQGMLFHTLYAKQPGVEIVQMTIDLHEDVNASALEQAWQRVIDRHPILRTSFDWRNFSAPLQEVHQDVKVGIQQQDWRGLRVEQRVEKLEAFLKVQREHGFDLSAPPLMSLNLFRTGQAHYQLIWTFHHILM